MHALQIADYVKRLISDHQLDVWGSSPSALFDHLNAAYEKIAGQFQAMDIGAGQVSRDYAWVDAAAGESFASYVLPPWAEVVKAVELRANSGTRHLGWAWPEEMVAAHGRAGQIFYSMQRRRVVLHLGRAGAPSRADTVRIHFYRAPSALTVFRPANADASTISFPDEPVNDQGMIRRVAGYYDGSMFEVVSGAGAGHVFEIDTFDGSDGTLLPGDEFPETPTSDSILVSVPSVPDRAHPLIAYECALEGARIEENVSAHSLLTQEVNSRWKDIKRTLSVRQVQASRQVWQTARPGGS